MHKNKHFGFLNMLAIKKILIGQNVSFPKESGNLKQLYWPLINKYV